MEGPALPKDLGEQEFAEQTEGGEGRENKSHPTFRWSRTREQGTLLVLCMITASQSR